MVDKARPLPGSETVQSALKTKLEHSPEPSSAPTDTTQKFDSDNDERRPKRTARTESFSSLLMFESPRNQPSAESVLTVVNCGLFYGFVSYMGAAVRASRFGVEVTKPLFAEELGANFVPASAAFVTLIATRAQRVSIRVAVFVAAYVVISLAI